MTAKGPWDRRFAFTAPFMVRMSMAFLRAIGKGGGTQDSFIHVILQVNYLQLFYNFQKVVIKYTLIIFLLNSNGT